MVFCELKFLGQIMSKSPQFSDKLEHVREQVSETLSREEKKKMHVEVGGE